MECLFGGFDYGLRDESTGELQVYQRRENTAFLTKHLRAYGGTGKYDGRTIGRVLRNITFSGKGLVENPANKESIFIFNDVKDFSAASLANEEQMNFLQQKKEVIAMEIADLQKQLAEANQKLKEMGEAEVTAKLVSKDAEIAKRDEQIAQLTDISKKLETEVVELRKSNEVAVEAAKVAEAAKTETEKKLTEATAKLAEIEIAAQKANRISSLVDKGVDKAEAEKLVEKFASFADEQFGEIVTMQAELIAAKKAVPAPVAPPAAGEEEATAEEKALAAAKADADADMNANTDPATAKQESQAALSAYLGNWLVQDAK